MNDSFTIDITNIMSTTPIEYIERDVLNTKEGWNVLQTVANVSKNSNNSVTGTMELKRLLRSYMQKLIDDKLMLKLSEIKKMDMLDTTSFIPVSDDGCSIPYLPDASPEERNAIDRLGWYSIVPCFEKGALKLNKFRYIVFEILEMDPEEKTVSIRLYDYMKMNDVWQTGVSTTITAVSDRIDGNKEVWRYVRAFHKEDLNFPELYTMYNAKDLHWTDREYKFWMDTVVKNSELVLEQMKKENTSQCVHLGSIFVKVISRCNAMLELNKPSRPIKPAHSGSSTSSRSVTYQNNEAPKRKIRNVGALRVQSENIPRKPCFETVITYKVAKWTVRGHVRHYKSGKTAYIKPTVRQRKALVDTDQLTATTIRFKNKKKET